ncbi:hypothetical protein [Methylobacterium oryzihabitans]|uniref:Uncharacterized protein n=1 Tax=Methylobacterium oryzihabitans TaxID=2499852 RepID=A0A3S2YXH8_9HYPH|nr:hypothetical protein [Methylobacterium oryzihabitans]RVU21690.1 hypothetical protein EOE48_01175 [Methylobacterium oryzihabitans]
MKPGFGAVAAVPRGAASGRVAIDRRAGVAAAALFAGSLALTGLATAWMVRPPAPAQTRTVSTLSGAPLTLPAAWFVRPGAAAGATPDRLDLAIPWSALSASGGDDRLHVTATRAPDTAAPLGPARRYARFLTAEVRATPDGLMQRRFRTGSPFEGEDLYLAQPDGNRFAARCATALPDPQGACLSEVRVGDLALRVRFAEARLPFWNEALAGLERIFGRPGGAP